MSDMVAEGGCLCGQTRFRVTGAPLFTMACHCRGCQHMSASAFSLSSCHLADQFALLSGEPVIGGLHGEHRQYHCSHCLAWVYTKPHGLDHIVNIRTTMFDVVTPEPPFVETCVSAALPWAKTDAAHSFAEFPPLERYAEIIADFAQRHAEVDPDCNVT
jgi:hypothetical protein